MKTIFVQIASYRDPECQWTVKDLFAKAKHPERLRVGICWQYDPETDKDCFTRTERPDQVRLNPFHWEESQGVCWARHQAQQLYEGEDYILSIDSHMRLAPQWDELMVKQLAECPSPKAVLSNHPAGYTPPDKLEAGALPAVLRSHLFTPQGDLHVCGVTLNRSPEKPLRGTFCAGKFIFAKGDIVREMPFDPFLYCDQEDIALSARLFTHGFDVYSPKSILLHHYYRHSALPDTPLPPRHQDDHTGWLRLQERGRKRLNHLLGYMPSENPAIIQDIAKYGLGTARRLEEYSEFCGVDFKKRTVSDIALRCRFIQTLSRYLDKPIHVPEVDDVAKPELEKPAKAVAEPVPQQFDQPLAIERVIKANPKGHTLNIDREAPEGVLIIYDYIDRKTCKSLAQYADSQAFTDLHVVDPDKTTKDKLVSYKAEGRVTHHVHIDGRALEILTIFNDIYCRQMAAFYDVDFEWYERPQILRYPTGGKYNQHADSDHWIAEKNTWERGQDRDYSVLLYLNDEFEGGEISLINQKYTVKPKPGMLLAFPSDHRYLHAALPTTSGIRYVIVSWAAIIGTPRVRAQMPFGSVYVRQKRRA